MLRRWIAFLMLMGVWLLAGCGGAAEPQTGAVVPAAETDVAATDVAEEDAAETAQPESADSISADMESGAPEAAETGTTTLPEPVVTEDVMTPAETVPDDEPAEQNDAERQVVEPSGEVDLGSLPTEEATSELSVAPAPGVPVPGELQGLVEEMSADLAQRTGLEPRLLRVTYVTAITWPDGGLGCPQPGQMVTMALVDGYQVEFSAEGERYYYHTAGTRNFVFCPDGERVRPEAPPGEQ